MKRSSYTLFVEDFPDAGKHLFYCTRTQAMVVIDTELREAVQALPRIPASKRSADSFAALAEMGFLVGHESEDELGMEAYFRHLKQDTSRVHATVLTTYACNFACPYCVEEGVKGPVFMDADTAARTAAYIEARVEEHRPRSLFVRFYGGEPLLNLPAIRAVAGTLQGTCRARGLPFSVGITTNGALLSPEVVEELQGYGLKGVKVTLDGSPEHHDRRRPFKNGQGTFELILENVRSAAERIDVDVGGNFDAENVGSFAELLDILKSHGLAEKLHAVRFKPISETLQDRAALSAEAELACVYSEPSTAAHMLELRRLALEKGFRTDAGVGVNACGVGAGSWSFTIDPTGRLFKCPALVGRPRFEAGDILSGERPAEGPAELWRRCLGCAYLPLCGEGCLFGSYLRFGDPYRLYCPKQYVEQLVRENLKLNYRHRARSAVPVGPIG